jgi:hypothetical protein
MFDLNRAVALWSASVQGDACRNKARSAELEDLLHCEFERARAGGLADEQAFAAAVRIVGSAQSLSAELAKDRPWWRRACAALLRLERHDSEQGARGLLLAHSLLWAALMIALALLVRRSSAPVAFGGMLTGVLVPMAWTSDRILRQALRRGRAGGAR